MSTALSPIVSEFETQRDADSDDQWFRAKVEASLRLADDPNTSRHSTDEVVRRMAQVIKAAEPKYDPGRLA
ncbi:MAG: stability determinant [Rhodoferax sp.]|nr:stability determinant [Rhodoferax sp.]